jgi:hypothetical protein
VEPPKIRRIKARNTRTLIASNVIVFKFWSH